MWFGFGGRALLHDLILGVFLRSDSGRGQEGERGLQKTVCRRRLLEVSTLGSPTF